MRQDVPAGRRTEVGAIGGYVLERAREYDLEVPVNETITRLLRGLGGRPRAPLTGGGT